MSDTPLTDASISQRTAYASTGFGHQQISMKVDYVEVSDCRAIERELREEIERLRKDAERYRWLRSSADLDGPHVYGPDDDCIIDGDDLDAEIDAALSAQEPTDGR